ncbi:MAG: hypothetical protein ACYTDY_11180 [Planctomycetota bacterium]|jgi:hypothetical protein
MKRGIGKAIVTVLILFVMAVGGYYAYRRQLTEDYPVASAPLDLLGEILGAFSSGDKPELPEPRRTVKHPGATTSPERADPVELGRRHYLDGEYAQAVPLLGEASRDPGDHPRVEIETLLSRARLFKILLADVEPESGLRGPPVALLTPLEGKSMLVTLNSETDDEVSFETSPGVGARLKKSELAALRIARGREARIALFEEEYRRRHETIETAAEHLELAEYAVSHGLWGHVTYLMEKALQAPGDGMEAALFAAYEDLLAGGEMLRAQIAKTMFRQFFKDGEYTAKVFFEPEPPVEPVAGGPSGSRPGVDGVKPPSGNRPGGNGRGGIGGVGQRDTRGLDPKVHSLLEKADRLRGIGEDHYLKAFPGMPDRVKHREKALDAFLKARDIYTELEEKWGVGLERTFKALNEKIYHLRKDSGAR